MDTAPQQPETEYSLQDHLATESFANENSQDIRLCQDPWDFIKPLIL